MSKVKRLSIATAMVVGVLTPLVIAPTTAEAAMPTAPISACPAGSIIFDGPNGGLIDDASNWDGNVLPGPSDVACLPEDKLVASNSNITFGELVAEEEAALFVEANTVSVTDANLRSLTMRTGGQLSVSADAAVWRSLSIQEGGFVGGGNVQFGGAPESLSATFDTSGTHELQVDFTALESIGWDDGDVNNAGYTTTIDGRIEGSTNTNTKTWHTDKVNLITGDNSGEFFMGTNTALDGDIDISGATSQLYTSGGDITGSVTQATGVFGMHPDDRFGLNRGSGLTTDIGGDYTHTGGALRLGVVSPGTAGSTYDQLTVDGTYALSGSAYVQILTDTYDGEVGDSFELVAAGTVTGEYNDIGTDFSNTEVQAKADYSGAGIAFDIVEIQAAGSPIARGTGYWLLDRSGEVYAFGEATKLGSPKSLALNSRVVSLMPTPTGGGYWVVAADGGVFAYGDAAFYGSMGGKPLGAPVVNMIPTPSGNGYWLVAEDGGVFAFGDATFAGSAAGISGKAKIVGIAATPSGNGYWLAAADGGVFAYGDAAFSGSMGGKPLSAPVAGIAADDSGTGYYLVGADGGVFAFGSSQFHGSASGLKLNAPIVSMKTKADGTGYVLFAADGGVFAYGTNGFYGTPVGQLTAPVVQ